MEHIDPKLFDKTLAIRILISHLEQFQNMGIGDNKIDNTPQITKSKSSVGMTPFQHVFNPTFFRLWTPSSIRVVSKWTWRGEDRKYEKDMTLLNVRSYDATADVQVQYRRDGEEWNLHLDYVRLPEQTAYFYLQLFLNTPRKGRTMSMKTTNFINDYLSILPYIDPDSPRFVDWMFGERMKFGLATHTRHTRMTNDDGVWTIPTIIPLIPAIDDLLQILTFPGELKTHIYQSNGFYRIYVIERVPTGNLLFKRYQDIIRFCLVVGRTESEITFVAVGEELWVTHLIESVAKTFKVPASITLRSLVAFGANGPEVNETIIKESDTSQYLAKDEFYPFLWDAEGEHGEPAFTTIEELAEAFTNDRATVLLLVGPPGVGKSTLLRTLMFLMKRKNNAAINNEEVLLNPGALPWIQKQPGDSFIMIEDADNFCRSRESGNRQMSALLNYTDGIAHTNNKIVISTNLPSTLAIDEALIRDGRTFRVLQFRELTADEAMLARAAAGKPDLATVPEQWLEKGVSLSNATNYRPGKVVAKKTTVGFRP